MMTIGLAIVSLLLCSVLPAYADSKPMPWTNAFESGQYIKYQWPVRCKSGSRAEATTFVKDGKSFGMVARRGFWTLLEIDDSDAQYVWFGTTDTQTGNLTVTEQGLVSELIMKYPQPCDYLDAMDAKTKTEEPSKLRENRPPKFDGQYEL